MRRFFPKTLTVLLAMTWIGAVMPVAKALAQHHTLGFLTGPQNGDPLEIAIGYLHHHHEDLGLTAADLEDLRVKDHYLTRHNGTTHIYLKQVYEYIEVRNGDLNVNIAADGSIINLGNGFVSDLAGKIDTRVPVISAREAIAQAAGHMGLSIDPSSLELLRDDGGPERQATFAGTGLSRDDIPVHLIYEKLQDGSVRLAWLTVVNTLHSPDWWELRVDAVSGELLSEHNWTNYDSYLVIPFPPYENPEDSGDQMVVVDPADPTASPFGWHDIDGAAGAEFTDTQGNNVDAHDDLDANNTGGLRPDGGPGLDFLFPWDAGLGPAEGTNLEAAIVNLFYVNNVMHDLVYHYGFDEAAGNFQTNNYGNGGADFDQVEADAQDGSGINNANFSTPPDGIPPRMQMFVWTRVLDGFVTVVTPGTIAGDYNASSAGFGPPLTVMGLNADVEEVDDGTDTTSDGCEPLVDFTPGNIALIDRGTCEFGVKVLNAENAGASGVIMVNDRPGILQMGAGAVGDMVTIPSLMVSQADGHIIRGLKIVVNATLRTDPTPPPNRDSDLDSGLIAHEYGHGISIRLTGGPSSVGCLVGSEQPGEGWSDFWTLVLTAKPEDTPIQPRGVGNYLLFQEKDGSGSRNFPYTTDMQVNPQTYGDIDSTNVPHGVGEIWMSMLWEVYWELVVKHGFDDDLYQGTGGNNLTIQLVIDGMKLQGCAPTFVTARDAILLADMNNNGGANQCEIWRAFAKRGLGAGAIAGGVGVGDEIESFALPPACSGGTGSNHPPIVGIESPDGCGRFPSDTMIEFTGTARDAEDGDLSDAISWTSDLDDLLGSGSSITRILSEGVHTITATVIDSDDNERSAAIYVEVGSQVLKTDVATKSAVGTSVVPTRANAGCDLVPEIVVSQSGIGKLTPIGGFTWGIKISSSGSEAVGCDSGGFEDVESVTSTLPEDIFIGVTTRGCLEDEEEDGGVPLCTLAMVTPEKPAIYCITVEEAGAAAAGFTNCSHTSHPGDSNPDNNEVCITLEDSDVSLGIFADGFETGDVYVWGDFVP